MNNLSEILNKLWTKETPFGQQLQGEEEAKAEIIKAIEEIIGDGIDYEKYGKCPACTASMMYQCTCDSGSFYTVTEQRKRLKEWAND